MLSVDFLLTVAVVVYVASIAIIDMRTHRIPNVGSAVALIVALTLQGTAYGSSGMVNAVLGMLVGIGFFLPFYMLRSLGAGDVKALAVVGAFVGYRIEFVVAAATLIAGAIIGLAVMLRTTTASATFYRVLGVFSAPLTPRGTSLQASKSQRFPYGVAIAAGTLIALARAKWLNHLG